MEVEAVWHCLLFGMQHICAVRITMAHIIIIWNIED